MELTWVYYPKPIVRLLQEGIKSCSRSLLPRWNILFPKEIVGGESGNDGLFDRLLTKGIDQRQQIFAVRLGFSDLRWSRVANNDFTCLFGGIDGNLEDSIEICLGGHISGRHGDDVCRAG